MKNRLNYYYFITAVFLFGQCAVPKQFDPENKIKRLLAEDPFIQNMLDSFETYESQIIYTQINRDKNNQPAFKSYSWNSKSDYYFYPASMVKMPAAILAAEKINILRKEHPYLTLFSPLRIDSTRPPQTPVVDDTTSRNKLANIAQYIKKIFVVSDNDAFNRLYEFMGQQELNSRLKELGYNHTHIIHRLDAPTFDFESNKYTNAITFAEEDLMIYKQEERFNGQDVRIRNLFGLQKGKGYIAGDSLIHKPFDFSTKNYFSLQDLSTMIRNIMFPAATSNSNAFQLSTEQLKYIQSCMSTLPRESQYPTYDSAHYDGYCKFFLYGDTKEPMPDHIRIFNKVGWAYGYLTDAAYIVDFKNQVEFILTATINTNIDGIYNDGKYAYESIGLPYLSRIGKLFYQYELKRNRRFKPDLTAFKLEPQP